MDGRMPVLIKFRSLSITVHRNHNRENLWRKAQQHPLKARDGVKQLSSPSPSLNSADKLRLSPDQAVGKVTSAQANFMRVVVESKGSGVELLCVVRNLLKKIKRRMLVGDTVLVGSIDWIDRRGMIENVFERKTELLDPPVANVDHLLVLFSFDQPKMEKSRKRKTIRPELLTLSLFTRFLVEAEPTRIPVTLALNKVELVDEEVRKILSDSQPLKCAFSNCLHLEEPGCVVKPEWCLVNPAWKRYEYYFRLLDEIKIREEFQLRTLGNKREGDVRFKMGDMGMKQAEPRLEPKKHRRQYRKTSNQSALNDLENELEDEDDESFLDDRAVLENTLFCKG